MQDLQWVAKMQEWLITNGASFLVDIVVFLIIIVAGRFAIRAICNVVRAMLKRSKRVHEALENFAVNVLNKVLWLVLLMIALPRLGVDIAPLIAGLGVTGFIVGFAFQETLGNLAAGLMITINAPFKKGDYVEAAGHAGFIDEINMMATAMITIDNKRIVIPNSKVWGTPIVNYTALDKRRVDLVVGISYSTDIEKAREVIGRVLEANDLVLDDPAPDIEVVEMADSSVNLAVRPWCRTEHYWDVFFSVNREIKKAFDEHEIEIPFPQLDVHLRGVQAERPG